MALTKEDVTALFAELTDTIISELKIKLDKDVRTIINSKFAALFRKVDDIVNTANEALKIARVHRSN